MSFVLTKGTDDEYAVEIAYVACAYACVASENKALLFVTGSTYLSIPQGPVSRKSRKLFGPEKPFAIFRPAYPVKPVFSYVVKGIRIKTTAKF